MAEKTAKKENIFKRIGKGIVRFFRDTKGEMKKVVWPSRKQVINNLVIVLVFVITMAVLVALMDFAFGWLVRFVINIGPEAAASTSTPTSTSTVAALLAGAGF